MEKGNKRKILLSTIIILVVVAIIIVIALIINNTSKEARRKRLLANAKNYVSTQNQINEQDTNSNTNSNLNNNTPTNKYIVDDGKLITEPIVLLDEEKAKVILKKMEPDNISFIKSFGVKLTFDIENKTSDNIAFRIIDEPKVNGYTEDRLVATTTVKPNSTYEYEKTSGNLAGITREADKIKEIVFSFAIVKLDENKEDKEILYIKRDNIIKTKYNENEEINVIAENKNRGQGIYLQDKLQMRAELKKDENDAVLRLMLINDGYTSPTVIENKPTASEKFGGQEIDYSIPRYYIGDLDYVYASISKLKINGVEIGVAFKSSIYTSILITGGGAVSALEIRINPNFEELRDYNLGTIENVELSGKIYSNEIYENGTIEKVVVNNEITEFTDFKVNIE